MWYTHVEQPFRLGMWTLLNGVLPVPFLVIYYGSCFKLYWDKSEYHAYNCDDRSWACDHRTIGMNFLWYYNSSPLTEIFC